MLENYPDILQIEDICEILKISPNTAYALLRNHEIIGFKCGKNWLVTKESVIQFILSNMKASKEVGYSTQSKGGQVYDESDVLMRYEYVIFRNNNTVEPAERIFVSNDYMHDEDIREKTNKCLLKNNDICHAVKRNFIEFISSTESNDRDIKSLTLDKMSADIPNHFFRV